MSLSRKLYIATEPAAAALTSHAPVGLCLPITQFPPSLLQNTLPSRGKFPFNVRLLSSLAFCKGFKLLQHSNLTISFAKHSHFVSGSERSGAPSRDNSLSSFRAWIAAIRRAWASSLSMSGFFSSLAFCKGSRLLQHSNLTISLNFFSSRRTSLSASTLHCTSSSSTGVRVHVVARLEVSHSCSFAACILA